MSAAITGLILVLAVSIAADFRVLNALTCLVKSSIRALNPLAKRKNQ